jgi:transcriptional regulator with XRE-family HTH domain
VPEFKSVENVAAMVRKLRKERGWSQEEFAAKCKLHRTYVGAIERAEENLTLGTLDKLAKALQVRPAELLASASQYRVSASVRRR